MPDPKKDNECPAIILEESKWLDDDFDLDSGWTEGV